MSLKDFKRFPGSNTPGTPLQGRGVKGEKGWNEGGKDMKKKVGYEFHRTMKPFTKNHILLQEDYKTRLQQSRNHNL